MKEQNANQAIILAAAQQKNRQAQLDACYESVESVAPKASIAQIYRLQALYCVFCGQYLHEAIGAAIEAVDAQQKKLHQLPAEEQIDYRLAHNLGVLTALVDLGLAEEQIIAGATQALQKAALLALARDADRSLPVKAAGAVDAFCIIDVETHPSQLLFVKGQAQHARQNAHGLLEAARRREAEADALDVTLMSVSKQAADETMATILTRLANLLIEPYTSTLQRFKQDPGHGADTVEVTTARILAISQVAAIINACIKGHDPVKTFELN